jgi:hypothetical protein
MDIGRSSGVAARRQRYAPERLRRAMGGERREVEKIRVAIEGAEDAVSRSRRRARRERSALGSRRSATGRIRGAVTRVKPRFVAREGQSGASDPLLVADEACPVASERRFVVHESRPRGPESRFVPKPTRAGASGSRLVAYETRSGERESRPATYEARPVAHGARFVAKGGRFGACGPRFEADETHPLASGPRVEGGPEETRSVRGKLRSAWGAGANVRVSGRCSWNTARGFRAIAIGRRGNGWRRRVAVGCEHPRLRSHSAAFQAHTRCNVITRLPIGQHANMPTIAQTTSDIVTSAIRSRRIWNHCTARNGWTYQHPTRAKYGTTGNDGPAGHADAGALVGRLVGRSDAPSVPSP